MFVIFPEILLSHFSLSLKRRLFVTCQEKISTVGLRRARGENIREWSAFQNDLSLTHKALFPASKSKVSCLLQIALLDFPPRLKRTQLTGPRLWNPFLRAILCATWLGSSSPSNPGLTLTKKVLVATSSTARHCCTKQRAATTARAAGRWLVLLATNRWITDLMDLHFLLTISGVYHVEG